MAREDAGREMLPTVSDPRLDALFRIGDTIWAERDDARAAFGSVRSWEFWRWLLWEGFHEYEQIRRLCVFPDAHLIHRVIGEVSSSEDYVRGGVIDASQVVHRLNEAGFDFTGGAVLDFGCGCGRTLQVLARYAAQVSLYGADVDADAIAWCHAQLQFAHAVLVPPDPPTAFGATRFDAVYAFSVFSHLPEGRHRRWLEELHRITRPGAPIVLTVQGRRVIEEHVSGRRPWDFPTEETLRKDLPQIERDGFRFYPYGRQQFRDERNQRHFDQWDFESYGSTFILESYIKTHWLDLFELEALHEAPNDWQDYVVLRRR